jgi:hypothetical protein
MLPLMVAATLSGFFVACGISGLRFEVITVSLAIGSGVLVHRCVDVPVRAALRRLPDRMMVLFAPERVTKTRLISLTSARVSERDR